MTDRGTDPALTGAGKVSVMGSRSLATYLLLLAILVLSTAITIFLPLGGFLPVPEALPAPKFVLALANAGLVLVVYGALGYLGLRLAGRLGFPPLWNGALSSFQRWGLPALIGVGTGVFFIVADLALENFHTLGRLPHPPFPTSLFASITAGIGEEIIFRLFYIPFWLWLISRVLLRGRFELAVFWIVSVASALVFAVAHLPSALAILGLSNVAELPLALWLEMLLLNGALSLLAATYFRKHGFLAAVGIHFWTDIIWHVVWGLVG